MTSANPSSAPKLSPLKAWLLAIRPPTLLLALAAISMGTFAASANGHARLAVALTAALTATLLQILSNFANDYGDTQKGTDSTSTSSRKQVLQQGIISFAEIRTAMIICGCLAAVSGITLLILAFGQLSLTMLIFLALGAASLWAAYAYTATDNPYGYAGLGDVMVFIFFGLVAVLGSYILQAGSFNWAVLLPASASGCLAVAVLNINNMRDLENDAKYDKRTVPVRIGLAAARRYHTLLLLLPFVLATIYTLSHYSSLWQWLFVVSAPLFGINGRHIWTHQDAELAPMLKQMTLTSVAFTLLFGIGLLLG
ncbi:MAG: 1,4-dihydroxy-2-naphthoate octaprenyltransferase [Deinococcota bacterium]